MTKMIIQDIITCKMITHLIKIQFKVVYSLIFYCLMIKLILIILNSDFGRLIVMSMNLTNHNLNHIILIGYWIN